MPNDAPKAAMLPEVVGVDVCVNLSRARSAFVGCIDDTDNFTGNGVNPSHRRCRPLRAEQSLEGTFVFRCRSRPIAWRSTLCFGLATTVFVEKERWSHGR